MGADNGIRAGRVNYCDFAQPINGKCKNMVIFIYDLAFLFNTITEQVDLRGGRGHTFD
jgi:hypothetical protein